MSAARMAAWAMRSISSRGFARQGGELVSGVPQIVKVSADQDSGECRHPDTAVEVAVTKRLAIWAGED